MKKKELQFRVAFKSIPKIFKKEKLGLKPNTIRKVDKEDIRFRSLKKGIAEEVSIINTRNGDWFHRKIKDITWWEDFVIISWYQRIEV